MFVAMLLAVVTILRPLDIAIWSVQSKMFNRAPSGEIVLVTDQSQQLGKSRLRTNLNVLNAVKQLDDQGARLIVIDSPLQRSASLQIDRELRSVLEQNKDRIVLTRTVRKDIDENELVEAGSPFFEQGMRIASSDIQPDFLGLVWGIEASHSDGGTTYPSIWNTIASDGHAHSAIYPDYSIDTSQLVQVDLAALGGGEYAILEAVRGKSVVIGELGHDRRSLKAPDANHGEVSSGLIQVIAAETWLRGAGQFVGSWL
ncbi:hypothetical protein, partial [Altererythrobacter sp.]|uniref:hypothetical protein n=1 Tax=Altererythrobacter sp. TaxID=1872480 RepID=UPI003D0211AB